MVIFRVASMSIASTASGESTEQRRNRHMGKASSRFRRRNEVELPAEGRRCLSCDVPPGAGCAETENRLARLALFYDAVEPIAAAGEGKLARLQHLPASERHETGPAAADEFRLQVMWHNWLAM